MDRRSFLTSSTLAAPGAAFLAAPACAQGKRTLSMVTSWPRGMAGVHEAAETCANAITELTDGSLTVDLRAAGELVGAFEVFDAVSAGQADMYHSAEYYYVGQHPAYAFFTTVPFGMTAQEMAIWYYQDGGQDLHDDLGRIFGLKTFLAGNTGAQCGGWFRREITGPEDFQGLKLRMPGLGGLAMGKLGASVQNIPGGEVYQALSTGMLDATEWVGPWADEKAAFYEITKFYYTAGFHEPGSALSLGINREVFESLTRSQQRAIEIVAAEGHQRNLALFLSHNSAALARLKARGVQVLSYPRPVWEAFGKAALETLEENRDGDIYDRILESYMRSMRLSSEWIGVSEGSYRAERDRVLA
ncbi:TRAP-type mannitol/chloroaromatic compound transport system substrate-binding protein [Rhodovulum imhoffii]|uniref:TRAP-type mannitol/chloroaromatic compound transport system substrate-binding protein n=1 Tax=Rhodovulum imhoffii TaxID=365340 RepID=A0A2T5BWB9_9RHOB|nr:ABC transporter substrate-binding protein [Rhodovulum imhoffii]MBK5935091.1 ABC transporter substrate-binding protein [Rhodovulum imhoffii]PTN03944.1 TRAP-type mannitol/chloroaromatic compound transport system substrate-binding protein [Rhodovulum imhoffii]